MSAFAPSRAHSVAPLLNPDAQFAASGGGEFSPHSVSYFGHLLTIDIPTGNISIKVTDLERHYHDLPYRVARWYDVQEQSMRLGYERTHANIEPRFGAFGNWHSDLEARIDDAWRPTQTEILVSGNEDISGAYLRDRPDFSRCRLTQANVRRVLGAYGIPQCMLDALGWQFSNGDFLLRTMQGGFRIATGRYRAPSVTDGVQAEIWVLDPINGTGAHLTSAYARNRRVGLVRELSELIVVSAMCDSVGHVVTYDYDPQDAALMRLRDRTGWEFSFRLDQSSSYQDPTHLRGIVRQRMVSEVRFERDREQTLFTYAYSNASLLQTVEHEQEIGKHTVRYHYDGDGVLKAIENSLGARLSLEYAEDRYDCDERLNPRLKIARITDPVGNELVYTHDSRKRRVRCDIVSVGGGASTVHYTYSTDLQGTKRRYVTNEEVVVTKGFAVTSGGGLASRSIAAPQVVRNEIRYSTDGRYNVERTIDPAGRPATYTYNEFNQVTKMVEPSGRATDYRYDLPGSPSPADPRRFDLLEQQSNELVQSRAPGSGHPVFNTTTVVKKQSFTFRRHDAQTATAVADRLFSTHRISSSKDAEGRVTAFDYDDAANFLALQPTKTTSPSGRASTARYDARGALSLLVDAIGRSHLYSYDNQGRIERYTDPWSHVLALAYYKGTSLARSFTDRRGSTIQAARNAIGQLTSRTDETGTKTRFTYTHNGRLASMVTDRPSTRQDPGDSNAVTVARPGLTAKWLYDARGDVVRYTNEKGLAIDFQRDERGRVFEKTFAISSSVRIRVAYDVLDRAVAIEDQLGRLTSLTYHAGSGWLDTIQHPPWADGQVTRPGRKLRYQAYNYSGQPFAVESTDLGVTKIVRFGYDLEGSAIFCSRDDGFDLSFQYNADSEQEQITDLSGAINAKLLYTANGEPREIADTTALDAAAVWKYTYTADINGSTISGRLFGRTVPLIGLTGAFRYDENGMPIFVGHSWVNPPSPIDVADVAYLHDNCVSSIGRAASIDSYRYDAQKQLIFESSGNLSADYDEVGNRLYRVDRATSTSTAQATYNQRNELMRDEQAYTYQYSAGALAQLNESGQVKSYRFDGEQRLRVFQLGSTTVRYAYDYAGRLVERSYDDGTTTPTVTKFDYVGMHPVLITEGQERIAMSWAPNGELLRAVSSASIGAGAYPRSLFVVVGAGASSVAWLDAGRNLRRMHRYDAWGNRTESGSGTSKLVDYIGYRGGLHDPLSKLTLYGARWYDASAGRWISEDALERIEPEPASGELGNLYRFARNNPLRYWDPAGMKPRNYFWIYLTVGGPDDWHGHVGIILPNKNGTVTRYSMAAENVNSRDRRDYEYLWWTRKAKVEPRQFKSLREAAPGAKDIVKIPTQHVEEIRRAIVEYMNDKPYYHILMNNCADFVNDVANAAPDVNLYDDPIPIDYFRNVKMDVLFPGQRHYLK